MADASLDDATENWWDSESLEEMKEQVVHEDDESADAYLRESWLSFIMAALRDARRSAGLSQQALAERLGTRQPAVSRLEHDDDTSLERFVEYLMACGRMPFEELKTAPLEGLRKYLRANPDAPRTEAAFRAWQTTIEAGELARTQLPSTGTQLSHGLEGAGLALTSSLSEALQESVGAAIGSYGPSGINYQLLHGFGSGLATSLQAKFLPFEMNMTNAAMGLATAFSFSDLAGGMRMAALPVVDTASSMDRLDAGHFPGRNTEGPRAFWRKAASEQGRERARPVAATGRQAEVAA